MVTTEDAIGICLWLKVHFFTQLLPNGVVAAGGAREREVIDIDSELFRVRREIDAGELGNWLPAQFLEDPVASQCAPASGWP